MARIGTEAGSNFHGEPELDVTGGLATTEPPVVSIDLVQDGRHVVSGYAKHPQPFDDVCIEPPLRIQRTAGKAVDGDDRPILRMGKFRGTSEAVRFVDDESDVAVLRWNPEGVEE